MEDKFYRKRSRRDMSSDVVAIIRVVLAHSII